MDRPTKLGATAKGKGDKHTPFSAQSSNVSRAAKARPGAVSVKRPTARTRFAKAIVDAIQGKIPELADVPPERLDWMGVSALLQMFHETSGTARTTFIAALGDVIAQAGAPEPFLAGLIDFATNLDLSQVEPDIHKLRRRKIAARGPVRESIDNFFAVRQLKLGVAGNP
jgi:hypothetical protein